MVFAGAWVAAKSGNFGGRAPVQTGVLLVRQVDRKIGLSAVVIAALGPRAPERMRIHAQPRRPAPVRTVLRLRGSNCPGDGRHDPLMQTAVGRLKELAVPRPSRV